MRPLIILKTVALGPQVNYTDRTATALSVTLEQIFEVRGCNMISAADPHGS
jgi:hypothetical protein